MKFYSVTKLENSLPSVVGEAGCPCVKANIGIFEYFLPKKLNFSVKH